MSKIKFRIWDKQEQVFVDRVGDYFFVIDSEGNLYEVLGEYIKKNNEKNRYNIVK